MLQVLFETSSLLLVDSLLCREALTQPNSVLAMLGKIDPLQLWEGRDDTLNRLVVADHLWRDWYSFDELAAACAMP